MIELSSEELRAIVAEARLAPSVHNVQPTRWRWRNGRIELLGDSRRSIPVADPSGRDWRLSHGTALEGFDMALQARGLRLSNIDIIAPSQSMLEGDLIHIASAAVMAGDEQNSRDLVRHRISWRSDFAQAASEDGAFLDRLTSYRDDLIAVRNTAEIQVLAGMGDIVGLRALRADAHRHELLAWMRLTRLHPDFERDGLNARAMSLNPIEALGARLVLGPMFRLLDRFGAAAALTSEAQKTRGAAAILLFHRPMGEDALNSGRAFYRAWLDIERVGFKGCPISVLADCPQANAELCRRFGVPNGRQLVSVFRVGRPGRTVPPIHARLPVGELIVA